jgi:hypothetical protein
MTAGELRKLQERSSKAQQQAQDLEDATFLALSEVHHAAEVASLKDRLSSAMEDASHIDVSELRDSFTGAVKDLASAKQQESAAATLKNHALVILSRRAFQASIHPAIVGAGKQNISKAGEFLGMPYATVRPYVIAGGALFQEDRAFLLSEPDSEDARIVNGSFDANSRKQQIDKRQKAALKAQAQAELLKQQQAEIEALKQAQQEQAPAAGEQQAGEQEQEQAPATAPAAGAQAPATAPVAPVAGATAPVQEQAQTDGPSLSESLLSTAKTLVAQIALLKKDKAEWTKVYPKMIAILGQSFPTLKS